MSVRASGLRRRKRLRLASIFVALSLPAIARTAVVQVAIIADGDCPAALHERIAEQLADVADRVGWSCLARFDAEDPFRPRSGETDTLQIWVDVTPVGEARLTLRDARADRFVVRRIPLPRGLDEIGREEIGQIVRSAALAALAGPAETLNREEARAEISRWTRPAPAASATTAPPSARATPNLTGEPSRAGRSPYVVELGPVASARAFSTPIPVVGEIDVAATIGRPTGIGVWLAAGYQLPARDNASPIGVKLDAIALRAGLRAARTFSPTVLGHLDAGGGFTRTSFTPLVDSGTVTTDPSGTFFSLIGRLSAGVDIRASKNIATGAAFFCDVVGADVHYDLRETDGSTQRVLTPFRLQPGIALQIAWSPSPP